MVISSVYPTGYDNFGRREDNVSDIRAADVNALYDAVEKIEKTLGRNVQGENQPAGWTVANRIGTILNADGTFKAGSINLSSAMGPESIDASRLVKYDTYNFNKLNVGRNDNGTYGYTGLNDPNNAGVTIDDTGNIWADTNIIFNGFLRANGATGTGHVLGAPLTVLANATFGVDQNSLILWKGILAPLTSGLYDIGTPTQRVRFAYIDNLQGTVAGGTTVTVGTSATFGTNTTTFAIIGAGAPPSSGYNVPYLYSDGSSINLSTASGGELQYNGVPLYTQEGFINIAENTTFDKWAGSTSFTNPANGTTIASQWLSYHSSGTGSDYIARDNTLASRRGPYNIKIYKAGSDGELLEVYEVVDDNTNYRYIPRFGLRSFYISCLCNCSAVGKAALVIWNGSNEIFKVLNQTTNDEILEGHFTMSQYDTVFQISLICYAGPSPTTTKFSMVSLYEGSFRKLWTPNPVDIAAYYAP